MRPAILILFLLAVMAASWLYFAGEDGILEDAYSQVVVVACQGSYGTGWWVNDQGYLVTAYHVIDACQNITLVRDPWASKAEVVAYDQEHDIAILRAENPPSWAEGLPLSYKVSIGDPIYVIGYPVQLYQEVDKDVVKMSNIPRVASGTVAWLHPEKPLFNFDVATDAGNSGGPVVSKESGGVVGLVVYARPGVVSEGYFGLRMDFVASFLDSHGVSYSVAGGPGRYAWAGVGALGALALVFVLRKG